MAESRTPPSVSIRHAEEFFNAAHKVCIPPSNDLDRLKMNPSYVAYYLLGHSIELSLKAFLLGRGEKISTLKYRPYGHNLMKLLSLARKRKLGLQVKLSAHEIANIDCLNDLYSRKSLEYTQVGAYKFPDYTTIYDISHKLVVGIKPYAFAKTIALREKEARSSKR